MKNKMLKAVGIVLVALVAFFMPAVAQGTEITSGSGNTTVALSLNIGESVSVSASPSSITFTAASGAATASGPISVTTNWNLAASRTSITTYAYFATANALTSGSNHVPAASVFASIDGGTAAACSLTNADPNIGGGGVCPTVFAIASGVGSSQPSGTHSDTVLLSIPSTNGLAVGSYSGTLMFIAIAV